MFGHRVPFGEMLQDFGDLTTCFGDAVHVGDSSTNFGDPVFALVFGNREDCLYHTEHSVILIGRVGMGANGCTKSRTPKTRNRLQHPEDFGHIRLKTDRIPRIFPLTGRAGTATSGCSILRCPKGISTRSIGRFSVHFFTY